MASDAEQGTEGVERIEAAVEAEGEFVEIGLKMLWADTVMDAPQPGLEIGEREVDDRQEGLGNLHVAALRNGGMAVAALTQFRVSAPVIGDDGGAAGNGALNETAQRLGAAIWNNGKANASCVAPRPALIATPLLLALADFNGACHECHVVDAPPFATGTPADVGFIGLDVFLGLTTNSILIGSHHTDAQLVKNLKCGLVARESELPLKLDSRHAGRLAGDQVRCPEPNRERRVRALHDSPRSEARITATLPTTEYARASGDTVRLTGGATTRADEAIVPSRPLKVRRTCCLVRKQALKIRQRARKRQIASLKNIDRHGSPRLMQLRNILPAVHMCDNPISTVHSFRVSQSVWAHRLREARAPPGH